MKTLSLVVFISLVTGGAYSQGVPPPPKNDWVTIWSKNLWYVGISQEMFTITEKRFLFFKSVSAEALTAIDFNSLDKKPLYAGLGIRLNTMRTDTGVDFSLRVGGGFTQEENFNMKKFQWYVGIGVRW